MDTQTANRLTELCQDYLGLGGDLLMLGGVVQDRGEAIPDECVLICLHRLTDYISQHTGDIAKLSRALARDAAAYFPRMAEK